MDSSELARKLADWQTFYATVAGATATLTGLLFVSLSINRERLATAENRVFLRLARRSFGDYIFVLAVSLVALIPKQGSDAFAITLIGLGISRLVRTLRESRHPIYRHLTQRTATEIAAEYAAPLASCLGMCAIGVAIYLGQYAAIYWLVVILLELMTTATRNAWRLLLMEKGA